MPDVLERLREADPVSYLEDAPAGPPPRVLASILATPREPRRRRPRAPRLALAAAALAVLVAVLAVAAPTGTSGSLAARALAATAPEDSVVYTETTITDVNPKHTGTTHIRTWQRGDRMHDVIDMVQGGKPWRYEHDINGDVFRTLTDDGKVQSIRADDPGWRGDEGRKGFASELQTVVDRFRAVIAAAHDAGTTTFHGKPAHAYTAGGATFYVDPDTALPMGMVQTTKWYEPALDPKTHKPVQGRYIGEGTITEVVDRFERLPPTPDNLAKLDAPAIDAAAHG